jgi:hypothetical protein
MKKLKLVLENRGTGAPGRGTWGATDGGHFRSPSVGHDSPLHTSTYNCNQPPYQLIYLSEKRTNERWVEVIPDSVGLFFLSFSSTHPSSGHPLMLFFSFGGSIGGLMMTYNRGLEGSSLASFDLSDSLKIRYIDQHFVDANRSDNNNNNNKNH